MASHRTIETAVGLFVLIAVFSLLLGILWGEGHALFSSRKRLTVRFQDVQGLASGDPVLVRGITVGQVEEIALKPDYAEARLGLDSGVPLRSDIRVWIMNSDLMGGKQVVVEPGSSPKPLGEQTVVRGVSKGDINRLLIQAGVLAANADSLLSGLLPAVRSGTIDQTLNHLEKTTKDLETLISRNSDNLSRTLDRIERASRQLESDSTLSDLNVLVQRMDTTIQLVNRLTRRIENQQGTAGMLIHDPALYQQLLRTAQEMDSLVTDIQANPRRYIHVSVF